MKSAPAVVTLHRYPDGSFSGCASVRKSRLSDAPLVQGKPVGGAGGERSEENARRSARRASVELRRKIRHGNLRRLLTFTNGAPGGWSSGREAVTAVLDWYQHHGGKELLGGSPMAVVPERGRNRTQRLHVHGAIRSGYRLDYSAVIASWSAYLTAQGFISETGVHRWHAGDEHGKGEHALSSARVCANYMAKYLAKDFEADAERVAFGKRYRVCGVCVPEPRRLVGMLLGDVPDLLRDSFTGEVECKWFESPDGDFAGWFIEVGAPSG